MLLAIYISSANCWFVFLAYFSTRVFFCHNVLWEPFFKSKIFPFEFLLVLCLLILILHFYIEIFEKIMWFLPLLLCLQSLPCFKIRKPSSSFQLFFFFLFEIGSRCLALAGHKYGLFFTFDIFRYLNLFFLMWAKVSTQFFSEI